MPVPSTERQITAISRAVPPSRLHPGLVAQIAENASSASKRLGIHGGVPCSPWSRASRALAAGYLLPAIAWPESPGTKRWGILQPAELEHLQAQLERLHRGWSRHEWTAVPGGGLDSGECRQGRSQREQDEGDHGSAQ
ncbi:unnamed protein product [Rangifer tarandus platyrhynchus]|uniref:Uncharacterized protein n=1 Tax=Rangifer tarandus platyrhynchus TaxID=3082113 RepID=A0ABN8Y4V8_RANTA|nr:unnamed protein product [Rangifer tarandus platyrhynchus]